MPLCEFLQPVRCSCVPGKKVALPGDRAELTEEDIKILGPGLVRVVVMQPEPVSTVDSRINLNTATKDELKSLKFIGAATAQKLMDARPLASLAIAHTASGLPASQWAEIEPLVTL